VDDLRETAAATINHDPTFCLAGGFATDRAFLSEQLKQSERNASSE
jgi:hypothetical protein